MVHGFIRHTTCDGSVSNDCYAVVLASLQAIDNWRPISKLRLTGQHCQMQKVMLGQFIMSIARVHATATGARHI